MENWRENAIPHLKHSKTSRDSDLSHPPPGHTLPPSHAVTRPAQPPRSPPAFGFSHGTAARPRGAAAAQAPLVSYRCRPAAAAAAHPDDAHTLSAQRRDDPKNKQINPPTPQSGEGNASERETEREHSARPPVPSLLSPPLSPVPTARRWILHPPRLLSSTPPRRLAGDPPARRGGDGWGPLLLLAPAGEWFVPPALAWGGGGGGGWIPWFEEFFTPCSERNPNLPPFRFGLTRIFALSGAVLTRSSVWVV
jgi:hypothetical protein